MKKSNNDNRQSAGDFSSWLHRTEDSYKNRTFDVNVPCGECTACCRSSLFIHVKPEETETLKHIPKDLLFAAPGLPKGTQLMGYNENGHCPMFQNNKCSIYDFRPLTCRQFDCRIFAATKIEMDVSHTAIVEQAKKWFFNMPGETDQIESSAVVQAAQFLRDQASLFPNKALPSNPSQLALLAIKVHKVFLNPKKESKNIADVEIAKRILDIMAGS